MQILKETKATKITLLLNHPITMDYNVMIIWVPKTRCFSIFTWPEYILLLYPWAKRNEMSSNLNKKDAENLFWWSNYFSIYWQPLCCGPKKQTKMRCFVDHNITNKVELMFKQRKPTQVQICSLLYNVFNILIYLLFFLAEHLIPLQNNCIDIKLKCNSLLSNRINKNIFLLRKSITWVRRKYHQK